MRKIKVRRWSGFVALFEHANGVYRSFADSAEDAEKNMRLRANLAVRDAAVDVSLEPAGVTGLHAVADRTLRFLSGLNLQDHSTAEQRESVEIVHLLLKALKPELYEKETQIALGKQEKTTSTQDRGRGLTMEERARLAEAR